MQTKSPLRIIVLLAGFMAALTLTSAAETVVSISSATAGVKVGAQVSVTVSISNAPSIALVHTIVGYNADVLELTDYQVGSFFTAASRLDMTPGFPSNPQVVDVSLTGGKTASGSGTIYTLTFTAKALGTCPISFAELAVRDGCNEDVAAVGSNGLVIVDTPLPVQISTFTATWINAQGVALAWKTASEIDNYGFEVQRSQSRESGFVTIPGSFQAGQGTSLEQHSYTYTDNTAGTGVWYYRIRQIDLDGAEHFTEPVQVQVTTAVKNGTSPLGFALEQNYPNPFNPTTVVSGQLTADSWLTLDVYDVMGRKIATLEDGRVPAGRFSFVFDARQLPSGTYFCRMTAGSFTQVIPMVLAK